MGTTNVITGKFRQRPARPAGESTPDSTPPFGEVVDLDSQRPHVSGEARCLHCAREWMAVAPHAHEYLECPACHLMRGVFVYACYPSSGLILMCPCGNDLFFQTPSGLFCPKCGATDTDFAFDPGFDPLPAA